MLIRKLGGLKDAAVLILGFHVIRAIPSSDMEQIMPTYVRAKAGSNMGQRRIRCTRTKGAQVKMVMMAAAALMANIRGYWD